MELQKTPELIRKLKEAKKEKGISYTMLQEQLAQAGNSMAMSTLKRVFAEGSEIRDSFSYEGTLRPIAEILLDDEEDAEVQLLRAKVSKLQEENERLQEMREHLEDRISFLLDQIEKKDRRMDEKDAMIQKLMERVL